MSRDARAPASRAAPGCGRAVARAAARALVAGLALAAMPSTAVVDDGRGLFDGQRPLRGRIGDHAQWLPPGAAACANCHRTRPEAADRSSFGGRDAGPLLDRASLTGHLERRGGPPSRYDRDAFCLTLRRGVDPAGVMLPRAMPRYEIDERDCDALWRFLTVARP